MRGELVLARPNVFGSQFVFVDRHAERMRLFEGEHGPLRRLRRLPPFVHVRFRGEEHHVVRARGHNVIPPLSRVTRNGVATAENGKAMRIRWVPGTNFRWRASSSPFRIANASTRSRWYRSMICSSTGGTACSRKWSKTYFLTSRASESSVEPVMIRPSSGMATRRPIKLRGSRGIGGSATHHLVPTTKYPVTPGRSDTWANPAARNLSMSSSGPWNAMWPACRYPAIHRYIGPGAREGGSSKRTRRPES